MAGVSGARSRRERSCSGARRCPDEVRRCDACGESSRIGEVVSRRRGGGERYPGTGAARAMRVKPTAGVECAEFTDRTEPGRTAEARAGVSGERDRWFEDRGRESGLGVRAGFILCTRRVSTGRSAIDVDEVGRDIVAEISKDFTFGLSGRPSKEIGSRENVIRARTMSCGNEGYELARVALGPTRDQGVRRG